MKTFIAKPAGYTVGIFTASPIASFIPMKPVLLWGVEVVDKIGGGERGDNGFGSTGR